MSHPDSPTAANISVHLAARREADAGVRQWRFTRPADPKEPRCDDCKCSAPPS